MRVVCGLISVLGLFASEQAGAQGMTLRGVRADVSAGIDRFYSENVNDNSFAYAASAGVDAFVSRNFVLGIEASYLHSRAKNVTADALGETTRQSSGEWGAALRAGVMSSPSTLVYVKGGIVSNKQRVTFDPVAPLGLTTSSRDRLRGYLVGAGIEQLIGDHVYLKAEGRYANYKGDSSRITALLGIGVLFGSPAEPVVVAPPPPLPPAPEPVAPATQTCPDGSVILATDACPAPPVEMAPPPPPPAPERG
jgi:outer membrane immunogenic protein